MKILLLRPRPSPRTIGLQHVMLVEPLELEVLAALARPQDECVIVDLILESASLEHFLRQHRPDLLCVTGYITNVPGMIQACRSAKSLNPEIRTVVGGVHCEVCPGDLDDAAVDFRVVRNPVAAFPGLLEHLESKRDLPAGVLLPGQALDEASLPDFDFRFPRPRRELTRAYRERYFYIFHDRVALLKTSFGCPYRCTFCFCRTITRDHYHERPLEEVLDELAEIGEREIYIVDDDFLASRQRVEAFLDGLSRRGLDKHFLVYGRADFIARHEDLLARFRRQGLRTVIVGFESFSAQELDQYHKGVEPGLNREAMAVLNRHGIDCFATLIVPPEWGPEDFRACGRHLRGLGILFVNLQPLTPLPGTEFQVDEESLLLDRTDFEAWDLAHLALRPTRLSPAEFYRELLRLYGEVVFAPRALWRHLRRHPWRPLLRMLTGGLRVRGQYRQRIREVESA